VRLAVISMLLCASAGPALACPPEDRMPEGFPFVLGVLVVMASWIASALALRDRPAPAGLPIATAAVEPMAQRRRALWVGLSAAFVVPIGIVTALDVWAPFVVFGTAASVGPILLATRAHGMIVRLRRGDACVLADDRHVAVGGIWMRVSPRRLAQCGMPRATIVRSQG
jgi:hypothetical protein